MLLSNRLFGIRDREFMRPAPGCDAPAARAILLRLILLTAVLQSAGCNDTPQPQATLPEPSATDSHAVVVSDATFQSEVLDSDQLVLVDVWAPWCGPCLQLAPTIGEVALEYEDRVKVAKLNFDENPGVAGQYEVTALPTLLFFRDGRVVGKSVGLQPKRDITAQLNRLLAAGE
jgi:thioredoxin 1